LTPETLAAILASPGTRAALAEAEAGRTAERTALLAELTEQELAAAVQADENTARVAALRAVYLPLAAKADEARQALQAAEGEGFAFGLSSEARIGALRGRLRAHGGAAIEAARAALTVEARIAAGAFSWRPVTTMGYAGAETHTEPAAGNASVAALITAIEDSLAELDVMERNAEMGPAAIERRIAEITAAIAEVKNGAPVAKRGAWALPHGDVAARRQVATMSSRTQR
jgi:hypothetical protein